MLHFARIGEGALGIGHAGSGWVGEDDFARGLQRADESVAGGIGLEEAAGPAGAPPLTLPVRCVPAQPARRLDGALKNRSACRPNRRAYPER